MTSYCTLCYLSEFPRPPCPPLRNAFPSCLFPFSPPAPSWPQTSVRAGGILQSSFPGLTCQTPQTPETLLMIDKVGLRPTTSAFHLRWHLRYRQRA
ncbi:hypothetical protein CCHR01_15049 [Colletotrichum chrysophilum]|uniref:Uncharacterized protein n=1 Tax=Colletotrichum chrysophilum TaxID=1836956 RepID=A0AAD9A6C2_9PEZI|nr:hypothetical protein CCHR01_15049 [Colletotrichum chrysophilum]